MFFFKKLFKLSLILFILVILSYIGLFIYAKISPKLPIKSAGSIYMYDTEKKVFNTTNDDWVKLKNISSYLIDATISIEDKNFYKHIGFDPLRILKAMYINIKSKNNVKVHQL